MPPRILIIETDSAFRASVAGHLRQAGFDLQETADRSRVRDLLARQDVDVILLGLAGLGSDWRSVLHEIRTGWPRIRVITLNRNEQIEQSIEAMRSGAFADLMPPYDLDALCDSVRAAAAAALQPSGGAL